MGTQRSFPPSSPTRVATGIALVVLLFAGCSETPTAPTPAPTAGSVVVMSDSLGLAPTRAESFPAQLDATIDRQGLRWDVSNESINGDTTAGGTGRVGTLLGDNVRVLVLALGANDAHANVPVGIVEQNLAAIIETARARNVAVLLCGLEAPPIRGADYAVAFREMFPRLAGRYGVPLVPYLLNGVAAVPEMTGPSGDHPNTAGAIRMAENVWPYLLPLLSR